jgi:hypothetical protein
MISRDICKDGKDSHEWVNEIMYEDGIEYKILHCPKCGYWC